MTAATALVTGQRPIPELARDAVTQALSKAGLTRADNVILFLSRDFARNPQAAVVAAARAAGSLSICGCTANGLLTEEGWQLDQSAAAALVISAPTSRCQQRTPLLSFSSHSRLPYAWQTDQPRAGLLDFDGATWAHGRVAEDGCAEFQLPVTCTHQALSTGLRPLADALKVEQCRGYELQRIGSHSAIESLIRALPPELRDNPPLHQIALLRAPDEPGIALLSANADGSISLAEQVEQGSSLTWAIRQPLTAEQQMRSALIAATSVPDFALMLSCIGRGPLFYGSDDLDLQVFRQTFPDTPLLGAYGTSQIVPRQGHNRLFHNAALALLFESPHV